jgi:hypothetical protein
MIPDDRVNIWRHTKNSLYPLYEKRARGEAPEMDCHAQAAEIYAPHHRPTDRSLDAGGGSGYFFHSLERRGLLGRYHLLDQTADFLAIGRRALGAKLPPERFLHAALEETPGEYEAVFCLNTLFALPDYRQGLERLLLASRRILVLRTALGETTQIRYETDDYLDPGAEHLKSYFNIWPLQEVAGFMESYGFTVSSPVDRRTGDRPEISAGKVFPWRWLAAVKN